MEDTKPNVGIFHSGSSTLPAGNLKQILGRIDTSGCCPVMSVIDFRKKKENHLIVVHTFVLHELH